MWKLAVTIALTSSVWVFLPSFLHNNRPPIGQAEVAPGWELVEEVFKSRLASGGWPGAGFAVYHRGKKVVDITGGYADYEAAVPWDKNTLCSLMSSTKGVAAVVIAVLVDRGLLDYNKFVKDYWPDFAQNGKDKITIEQLISHQAGLSALDEVVLPMDLLDKPNHVENVLAKQKPWCSPGESIGYHAYTIGWYMNVLVRKIDPHKRNLVQFFYDEIAKLYGLDFFIGLPLAENYRCARNYPLSMTELPFAREYWPMIYGLQFIELPLKSFSWTGKKEDLDEKKTNNPYLRLPPSPSGHGFATPVAVAKLFGILANGGSDENTTLLSERGVLRLNEPVVSGTDKVLNLQMTYGRGTTLIEAPHGGYTFGTPGFGGQVAYGDPKYKLGWSFLTNHLSLRLKDHVLYMALREAMYTVARKLEKTTDQGADIN